MNRRGFVRSIAGMLLPNAIQAVVDYRDIAGGQSRYEQIGVRCEVPDRPTPTPKSPEANNPNGYYPVRGGWWSVNGYWNTRRDYILHHMINSRNHRGHFDVDWLRSLDRAELHSLHSDHHEGRLNRAYIGSKKKAGGESADREAVRQFLNVQRPVRRRRRACPT